MLNDVYTIVILVDNDSEKWGKKFKGMTCYPPKELQDIELDKIVVLVNREKYAEEIDKQLCSMGMEHNKLFIRDFQKKTNYRNLKGPYEYEDVFHNKIIVKSGCEIDHMNVSFMGGNNTIIINEHVRILYDIFCKCTGCGCLLEIGRGTLIVKAEFFLSEGGKIEIGEDCLLAARSCMMQDASHPIYDLATGLRTNMPRNIVLGRHVWVGLNACLMPGFSIGESSIVGANAVSSSQFGKNCTVAGNPARVIRENVTWKKDAVGYGDFMRL